MAGAMKKVDKIRQILRLKQVLLRWKYLTLRRPSSILSFSDSASDPHPLRRAPSGFLAVYIGLERRRFFIPARFLNLPIFVGLLNKAEEEFGFQSNGGLVLPCDVPFFTEIIKFLGKDEHRFGKFSLDEFVKFVSEVGCDSCKENTLAFTPLLQKASV